MTFTVTNLDDSGIGSLRQAILDANNAAATDDTIVFQSGLSGLLLTAGGMTITGHLTLEGPGNRVTINGNNAARIFTVNAGVTATLSKLKLRNGGIDNNGTLTINDSTIESSTWSSGGAIYNNRTLTGRELSVIPHGAALPPDGELSKFPRSWWVAGPRVRDDEVAPKG